MAFWACMESVTSHDVLSIHLCKSTNERACTLAAAAFPPSFCPQYSESQRKHARMARLQHSHSIVIWLSKWGLPDLNKLLILKWILNCTPCLFQFPQRSCTLHFIINSFFSSLVVLIHLQMDCICMFNVSRRSLLPLVWRCYSGTY